MELREFAEQVLFSTTLEAKLDAPRSVTDERPGTEVTTPPAPGRPAHLRFKPARTGNDFPRVDQLENGEERGRLLHFFANHELLATELMALVLLRFPDAPSAFRRDVLQTLKDEQEHTRMYIARMRGCGIEFGDLPVSGYFWRAISGMQNPMDYVAGLSLTFEQANLDFARHFATRFQAMGDTETGVLLEKIYADEIGHVAYGLKWFRRWKNPDESDWQAFCRQLKFPLSPRRARGGAQLNIEGRRAAGLRVEFIEELNVFSQSRGRTPDVFLFNPFAEGHIAYGRAFTPVKHQAQLAQDLQNLPQFLCGQDDVVLVNRRPAVHFLSTIQAAGFALPEFVEIESGGVTRLASRKLGRLRPWAWSPDSTDLLAPLVSNAIWEGERRVPRFTPALAELYSKSWSAEFLREFLASTQERYSMVCPTEMAGVSARSMEEANAAIAAIRARGHHKLIVKQALGLAGHNAIRLWERDVTEAQRRWISAAVERNAEVIVEPWLERVADFSVQLDMTASGLKLVGFAGLSNDLKGQFRANWAEPGFRRRIPAGVAETLAGSPGDAAARNVTGQVYRLYNELFARLEIELRKKGHQGPLGIDAFIYAAADGRPRLKPIVEINPRYTMGRLTLELMKQVAPGSFGLFRLITKSTLRAERIADFTTFARQLTERFPLRFEGEPVPRIREGAVCLNDAAAAQCCLAAFEIQADRSLTTR
jgi:uncharacterized ferritin-like protein (DUF455 family)